MRVIQAIKSVHRTTSKVTNVYFAFLMLASMLNFLKDVAAGKKRSLLRRVARAVVMLSLVAALLVAGSVLFSKARAYHDTESSTQVRVKQAPCKSTISLDQLRFIDNPTLIEPSERKKLLLWVLDDAAQMVACGGKGPRLDAALKLTGLRGHALDKHDRDRLFYALWMLANAGDGRVGPVEVLSAVRSALRRGGEL